MATSAVAELRALIERRFDPSQKRDGGGKWAGLGDPLNLAGKIDLAPDEHLIGSGKVDGNSGGVRMALTVQHGRPMLRFGAGGEGYGQADRSEGIHAWDGNHAAEQLPAADVQRLDAEFEALDAEYDSASATRQAEIEHRQDAIKDLLPGPLDGEFNGTAKLDEYSMRRLADKIRPALAEAIEQNKIENKAWDEIDALEAEGSPDPDRLAKLRVAADADRTGAITFTQGILPGSEWGDVHYELYLDDVTVGPELTIGVAPKDAPDGWGDRLDWQGALEAPEIQKLLRLLDKFSAAPVQRSHSQENGASSTAAAPAGGQFAAGGGRVGGKGKHHTAPRHGGAAHHAPAAPSGPLAFDGKSGTGYGVKGGDPRVRGLQATLNRLGLTDADGAALVDDGRYGPRTTAAVKKLQKALGMPQDGKATPELLKKASDLKQLPSKAAKKTARRARLLAGIARALERHPFEDGECVTCNLDGDAADLLTALDELSQVGRAWASADHPRNAKGAAGGGRFRSNVDKLKDAITEHKAGDGQGDPFKDFDREQLRRVAKARGLEPTRGESRESISKRLIEHLDEAPAAAPEPKPEPVKAVKPVKKAAPRKVAAKKASAPAKPKPAEPGSTAEKSTFDVANAVTGEAALLAAPSRLRVTSEAQMDPEKRKEYHGKLAIALEKAQDPTNPNKRMTTPENIARLHTEQGKIANIDADKSITFRERSDINDAVVDYMQVGYLPINGDLHRTGGKVDAETPPGVAKRIADLDQLMDLSRTQQDMVLYRGTRLVGEPPDEIRNPGFGSATASEEVARDFSQGMFNGAQTGAWDLPGKSVVYEIRVPKGTKASQLSGMNSAAEILLNRGLKLRKVEDRGELLHRRDSKIRTVVYEVVSDGE